jgi:Circadian oscillating protein COP23
MRQKVFGQVLTGLTRLFSITVLISATVTALGNQPSYAAGTSFFCGKSKYQNRTVPGTYARTQDGKQILMLRWISDDSFPPPWTAQQRCYEVSRRFQRSYDNGTLKYLTAGIIKKQSVVCAIANQGDVCTDSNLLFTLKPGTKPSAILAKLMDRRGLVAGRVLNESGGDELTIDIDAYLQGAASEE